jgi:hypothetical protein
MINIALTTEFAITVGGVRGGTARPCLPRTPAHSTFSARVANLGAPIEAASTI